MRSHLVHIASEGIEVKSQILPEWGYRKTKYAAKPGCEGA